MPTKKTNKKEESYINEFINIINLINDRIDLLETKNQLRTLSIKRDYLSKLLFLQRKFLTFIILDFLLFLGVIFAIFLR